MDHGKFSFTVVRARNVVNIVIGRGIVHRWIVSRVTSCSTVDKREIKFRTLDIKRGKRGGGGGGGGPLSNKKARHGHSNGNDERVRNSIASGVVAYASVCPRVNQAGLLTIKCPVNRIRQRFFSSPPPSFFLSPLLSPEQAQAY